MRGSSNSATTFATTLFHKAAGAVAAVALALGVASCDESGNLNVFLICPAIDLVFVLDTSGSMSDEGQALCDNIADVQADLDAQGAELRVTLLGITEDGDDDSDFSCLTDTVEDLFNSTRRGVPLENVDDNEDWGPATALIAARFDWLPNAIRIIVPISDEDPQDGDATSGSSNVCEDPGSDRDSVTNAINAALANDVILSPIMADQTDFSQDDIETLQCVETFMRDMATATGGQFNKSTDASADLAGSILSLVEAACEETTAPRD